MRKKWVYLCGMEEGKKRHVYEEYISPSIEEEVKI
jgi:hypothetical protein